ncbi:MAG: hypothetical protein ACRDOA_16130 [Streptosporangiaceae bacterium]
MRDAVLAALLFFSYTTITGTAGYCLHLSIRHCSIRQWKPARPRGLYGLAIGFALTILIVMLIRTTQGLANHLELTLLSLPYILGFFGVFFIPGDIEIEEDEESEGENEKKIKRSN